jgi:hypothetical protein
MLMEHSTNSYMRMGLNMSTVYLSLMNRREIMLQKVGDEKWHSMCQIFSFPLLLYHSHYGGTILHYLCV